MQNDERKFPISKSPNLQIINHQSSIINHQSPDAWLHVLAGGAAGFLLSLPLGMLSEATPSAMAVLLGLPLAAAAVALLFGWIRDGHLPRLLPALGVAVLLVDLFAAGGIAFPGVAGSLWLLMALGLVGGQPRMMQSAWAWTALAGALALALICYATAYSPVLGCQTQLRMSEAESTQAVEHLKAAASADPWAAEPWLRLADAEFKDWLRSPNAEAFERFEWAATNLALRAPNSAQFRSQIGGWYSQAASMTDGSGKRIVADAAKKAVQAYRRTVDFYPNSALNRANLAEAYLAAGDRESYRREAETALRLDKATPHSDKKLPAELRNRLLGDQSDK